MLAHMRGIVGRAGWHTFASPDVRVDAVRHLMPTSCVQLPWLCNSHSFLLVLPLRLASVSLPLPFASPSTHCNSAIALDEHVEDARSEERKHCMNGWL